jgi:methylmalonyl-CoA/ethylmalonyl-CoA epimerase
VNNRLAESISPPGDVTLHHVGFVVSSIQECVASFALSLGADWDGIIFSDPIQKVRVTFFQPRNAAEATVELVEPVGSESPVWRFLERGGGMHHLCYQVTDLEEHLKFCKSVGTIIIRPPVPAVAFGGRRIAWGITKKKLLMEFLESSPCDALHR